MSFSRMRGALASRAIGALLTVLVCAGSFDWGHSGGDDPDCSPVLIHHDHTAHHFSAAPAGGGAPVPDHCYICHSLRLLHTGLTASSARAIADTSQAAVTDVVVLGSGRTTVDGRTSRGPPALSL
jgi:hypothetical protein